MPTPTSPWAWGDPSHTRVVQKEHFIFLNQQQYTDQVGHTPMSDFRNIYKADFVSHTMQENEFQLYFVLIAIKPSRIEKKFKNQLNNKNDKKIKKKNIKKSKYGKKYRVKSFNEAKEEEEEEEEESITDEDRDTMENEEL